MSKEMLEDPASYFIGVGIEQERERIIKLLEKEKKESWSDIKSFIDVLIAIIKGEQE